MYKEVMFTRSQAIREAAAILIQLNDRVTNDDDIGVSVSEYQATVSVAQVWATIGCAMQPGESLTAVIPTTEHVDSE